MKKLILFILTLSIATSANAIEEIGTVQKYSDIFDRLDPITSLESLEKISATFSCKHFAKNAPVEKNRKDRRPRVQTEQTVISPAQEYSFDLGKNDFVIASPQLTIAEEGGQTQFILNVSDTGLNGTGEMNPDTTFELRIDNEGVTYIRAVVGPHQKDDIVICREEK